MNSLLLRKCTISAVTVALAACNGNSGSSVPGAIGHVAATTNAVPACQGSRIGMAQCDVLLRVGANPDVPGLSPANLQQAYKLTAASATNGTGQIVALVDAYDNPNVASDLATYRTQFGLPVANFTKYNQLGQTNNYPMANAGWGLEIDLDVDMVSASCPKCTIYLVEANSAGWNDLQTAEAEAVALGATIISNSFSGAGANAAFFSTPHKTYLASAGDNGYGIADPADFKRVVSVGGTTLVPAGPPRHWSETVWAHTGAGCSTVAKPLWQTDAGCAFRTANDVAADADPNTGVAAYDSYMYAGWVVVGGTSAPTALLAGIFGLKGNSTIQKGGHTFWIPANQVHLYPILAGNDGACVPAGSYLCTAGTGQFGNYSGPGGWGSPKGINAF
jgi:subtilase family serine protease